MKKQSIAALALVALALPSLAGIKYWDNPAYRAFDVGDYVQDGLVLHYDGIRNAGADADHDSAATTWKNLGTGGADYDMTRYSLVSDAWQVGAAEGAWTDKGFVFDKNAVFHEAPSFTVPVKHSIQALIDASASAQGGIGYVFCPSCDANANEYQRCTIGLRSTSFTYGGTALSSSLFYSVADFAGGRAGLAGSVVDPVTYATAILDTTNAVIFTGTAATWDASGASNGHQVKNGTSSARTFTRGIALGGYYSKTGDLLKGTVKSVRFYSRCLSDEEVAWNRVVDEARYFGRVAALPVTNVVVVSTIPIVGGDEPVGCYALDAGGHTFSAPASRVVKGRTYTCAGYTLETWDPATGTWGAPVSYESCSYSASASALVRLTWQWTAGDGLVSYDADDYVQDGLVLHYDGIRNAGRDAAHDSAATTWVNLGTGGATYDMLRYSLVSGAWQAGATAAAWTDNGFVFSKNALFHEAASFTVQTKYTIQAAFEATANDQEGDAFIMCPSTSNNVNEYLRCSLGIRNSSFNYGDATLAASVYHNAHDTTGGRPAFAVDPAETQRYATAMLDGSNGGVCFAGTTPPWNATGASNGHLANVATPSARTYAKGIGLGARHGTTSSPFKGTIHDFRYYNRVLTDAEIAWNRIVDEARYFTDPNVVVASTRADVQANEPDGDYTVSGSYTFTAPASVTNANGIVFAPAGYAVQSWDDENGVWSAATEHEGASYAYTTAAGKVRLLWRWKAVRGLRTAADYDVSDYVAGGLLFHLDGIRNAGADAAHAETPETWANLGTSGAACNANIRAGDAARVTNWTERGYWFDGNTRFFATFPYTTTFTFQLCTDAIQNDQHNPSSAHIYPFTAGDSHFAFSTYNTRLYFRTQGAGAVSDLGLGIDKTKPWGPITATLDDATRTAAIFPGANPAAGARKTYDTMARPTINSLTLGGGGSDSSHYLIGTINYFRYYDRVLSADELAQNREVDEARYFGALTVTNLVVEVAEGEDFECDPAPGFYKVEGAYEFAVARKPGKPAPAGYRLQDWDPVNERWTNARVFDSLAYTYDASSATATKQRLVWRSLRPLLFVVR